jgi:hypothetical protein
MHVCMCGASGKSRVFVPHMHPSDLLCVRCVLLCVPSYQHDKEKNYPCQLCDEKFGQSGHLKSHVLSKVSAGKAVVRACDRPSDLSCVLLYMQHEGISYKEQKKQAKKKRDRK